MQIEISILGRQLQLKKSSKKRTPQLKEESKKTTKIIIEKLNWLADERR